MRAPITRREMVLATFGSALIPGATRASAAPVATPVVKRVFVDGDWGQVHARISVPKGPANRPPIVCLHQTPLSSRMFANLLGELAVDRVAVAIDTPGYGESAPPPGPPEIADYAGALLAAARAVTGTRPGSPIDVLGYHTGTIMGVEMALREPKSIRRLVLSSMPIFDATRRAELLKTFEPDPIAEDGAHILKPWKSGIAGRGPGQTLEMTHRNYTEKLRADPDKSFWALQALARYPIEGALPRLTQPILILQSKDTLYDHAALARRLQPRIEIVERPDLGNGLFDVDPRGIASSVRSFLDR
jgi:pimeloyl-ACP methyl ester carboxylesterase